MDDIKVYEVKLIYVRKKNKHIARGCLLKGRERFKALQLLHKKK